MRRRRWATILLALGAGLLAGGVPAPGGACHAPDGRVFVPPGLVLLGEDGPAVPGRPTAVPGFWIDRHEVTNRQYAAFVAATGHVTQAERDGASALFVAPTEPVALDDAGRWWRFVRGADWRHPGGPGTDLSGKAGLPVVHVTHADAAAYARWAGGELPDAVHWERAARAGQTAAQAQTSWAYAADGRPRANVWQGVFPIRDTGDDGHAGIAPAGCYPPNALGLSDMIGNVWEWTTASADDGGQTRVRGGSYLCAMDYCANFRPAGQQAQERDLGTSHIGFRTMAAHATGRDDGVAVRSRAGPAA